MSDFWTGFFTGGMVVCLVLIPWIRFALHKWWTPKTDSATKEG